MNHQPPKVVIVGRTNVGKSTLFNRLIESQKSLISDIPGTTRDRFEADAIWRAQVIRLVDTGGLDADKRDEIEIDVEKQARFAMEEADLLMFVVDLKAGLQKEDRKLAKELAKTDTPVLVAGNKADTGEIRALKDEKEWHSWEMDVPMPVSATRGIGTGDLLDKIFELLEKSGTPPVDIVEYSTIRVAVLGKPNVGKSSLINGVVGEKRFIASAQEHTTRQPNDTLVEMNGQKYLFIDTAGIRKLARVHAGKDKLEITGVKRSLRAVKKADVVLFVVDVSREILRQDKHLAGKLADSGASAIIVANKWDLIPDKDPNTIDRYEEYIRYHLPMLDYAPIVFTSAHTGKRIKGMFKLIDEVYRTRFEELTHPELHKFISKSIKKHKPSRGKGAGYPKIVSLRQTGTNPPTFEIGMKQKRKDALNETYLRFLENQLRDHYDFEGTPIKIYVKAGVRRKKTIKGDEYEK